MFRHVHELGQSGQGFHGFRHRTEMARIPSERTPKSNEANPELGAFMLRKKGGRSLLLQGGHFTRVTCKSHPYHEGCPKYDIMTSCLGDHGSIRYMSRDSKKTVQVHGTLKQVILEVTISAQI